VALFRRSVIFERPTSARSCGRGAVGGAGQVEAATAVGLTSTQTMRYRGPAAGLEEHDPSLVTQFICSQDTSLASIIGFMDLTRPRGGHNREVRPFALYLFIAVVYWTLYLFHVPLRRHVEPASLSCPDIRAQQRRPPPLARGGCSLQANPSSGSTRLGRGFLLHAARSRAFL